MNTLNTKKRLLHTAAARHRGNNEAAPDSDPQPSRLHLDKRAEAIIEAIPPEATDDDLLTTVQEANWLGVSTQWLEIGRVKNYGPPFIRLAPQMVRYRRGDTREWLKQRQYAYTGQYSRRDGQLQKSDGEGLDP